MPEQLPPNPSIDHLKKQARRLLKSLRSGSAEACERVRSALPRWCDVADDLVLQAEVPLRDAQQVIAREYNFTSWQHMKTELNRSGGKTPDDLLADAITMQDTATIADLMAQHPDLFDNEAPYNAMRQAVREDRIDLIRFLLAQGLHPDARPSDGSFRNAPLMSAVSNPMRDVLFEHGANVDFGADTPHMAVIHLAAWNPEAMKWLLAHGADPDVRCADYGGIRAIDFVCGSGNNGALIRESLEVLINGGATYLDKDGPALDLLRGRMDLLEKRMENEPKVLTAYHMRSMGHGGYPRGAPLGFGATLLHLAAEHDLRDAASWLLDRGADVNAPCRPDGRSYASMLGDHPDYETHREIWRNTPFEESEDGKQGIGRQTPIFHAVNHSYAMTKLLIDRGADLSYRAGIRTGDWAGNALLENVTPLGYALNFNDAPIEEIVALVKEHNAPE